MLGLVPPTLRLPLVPDLPSTDMTFPDFNILKDCIKVVARARFSRQEGSEDNQGHRHVHN